MDKCQVMKNKITKYYSNNNTNLSEAKEPILAYVTTTPLFANALKTKPSNCFTFKQFKKIADKIEFTLQDWADLLYISERTLQRYAKTNASFNGLQIERILLFKTLIDDGLKLFGKNLAKWLKEPSFKYNGDTPFSKLFNFEGIIDVTRYIGQLEWGVLP